MVITKKDGQLFQKKMGVTPSVAAPGDTHPSDATVCENSIAPPTFSMVALCFFYELL